MPSSVAFASFEAPGSSPTTSAYVRLDTLPGDLPPRALMASAASSRLWPGTEPVTTYTYTLAGTYQASVTVTDPEDAGNNDRASASITAIEAQQTTAQLSVSPSNPRSGETVEFDASNSIAAPGSSITDYAFDFDGDGTTDHSQPGPIATHRYTQPGTYLPSVTVTDDQGGSHQTKLSVQVRPAGQASDPQAPAATAASGSGAMSWWLLILAAATGMTRRFRLRFMN